MPRKPVNKVVTIQVSTTLNNKLLKDFFKSVQYESSNVVEIIQVQVNKV
jgi:hypothetical protein